MKILNPSFELEIVDKNGDSLFVIQLNSYVSFLDQLQKFEKKGKFTALIYVHTMHASGITTKQLKSFFPISIEEL